MDSHRPIDQSVKSQLDNLQARIEKEIDADILTIVSPIISGLEGIVKKAVESILNKKVRVAVVLDTPGGVVEVVERMVDIIRHHYNEVYFLIPDTAMSAGTIFAMSGDKIFMSYYSVLGPIDPQIEKDKKLVPALSYLSQWKRLSKKADEGTLNSADFALLEKLDPGELHQFEQARQLSIDLLKDWLSKYKFKSWNVHSSTNEPVTADDKKERANEIGRRLSNNEEWHSHNRGINRDTLTESIRVKIDQLESKPTLYKELYQYYDVYRDFIQRENLVFFVHTRGYYV